MQNTLRGTLTLRGLGVSIAPRGEIDLDETLGRRRAERSNQVIVAFEEGYMETIRKSRPTGEAPIDDARFEKALDERLEKFKLSLREELGELRGALGGDVKKMLEGLRVAKLKLNDEKRRVLVDTALSAAEIRARLAYLEEQERELTKNFQSIGRKAEGSGEVEKNADLLSSI
ncbi:MAG: hypothetical protein ACYS22_00275 [Planctomycetota bacterium]